MQKGILFRTIFVFLCLALYGCQVLGPEESAQERTLPGAEDFPLVAFDSVWEQAAEPGFYNMAAYVVRINECPPRWVCIIPDGITLAMKSAAYSELDRILFIPVINPGQFQVNRRYRFSIELDKRILSDGYVQYDVRLIGYDAL